MRKNVITLILAFASVLMFTGISTAFEFSADTIMTSDNHKMTGKIFSKQDRFRMEMTAEGQQMITITRADKKVVWHIMPQQSTYMEMPFNPNSKQAPKTEIKGEIERKLVGSENIDGHPTKKYLVTYKEGPVTEKVYQWMATDINFPIKTADLNNRWVQEFKNVKIGSQPDKLFEVPSGYTKMSIPAMSGMPQGMAKGNRTK